VTSTIQTNSVGLGVLHSIATGLRYNNSLCDLRSSPALVELVQLILFALDTTIAQNP